LDLDCIPIDDQLEKERLHRPIMLLVGGNVQRKGLPVILKAMPELLKKIPGLTLQVIGNNQNIGTMKKLVHQLGIGNSVEFFGWIHPEKISTYYRKASVFVMPSLMEGFGLVFLEAMAQGLPVIGGNVGGTLELIRDGKNGFLVNPGDGGALVKKIREYIVNLDLRRRIINNGYSTVQKYSKQRMINDTIELYKEFI
jgi:glycosyltransferase involved in cell wall biosynthesis